MNMSKIALGLICGLAFGLIDVALMVPMKFDNSRKRAEALSGAFIERFMLGFLIPNVSLDMHQAISGALLGLGLSLPTAIITRVYLPIIGIGVIGGVIIGFIAHAFL